MYHIYITITILLCTNREESDSGKNGPEERSDPENKEIILRVKEKIVAMEERKYCKSIIGYRKYCF